MSPVQAVGALNRVEVGWAVYLPVILVLSFAFFSEYDAALYRKVFDGELGIVENLQVLFLIVAAFFCLKFLIEAGRDVSRRVKSYCVVFLMALVFVAGEEISWGQVYFNWDTPEWYASVNKQGETNLHNASSWLNFKPRIVVQFMIIFFGLAGPFVLSRLPKLASWKKAIMPDVITLYCAGLCLCLKGVSMVNETFDGGIVGFRHMRLSEVQELFFYFFFLSYAYSIYRRHKTTT